MGTKGGPNIVLDGLVGAIDAGSLDRNDLFQVSDDFKFRLMMGSPSQFCFINDATTISTESPFELGFGADRNTYTQIPIADGTFPTDNGPFDFSAGDGYSVNVWVMRTGFGTWQSGDTNYDGIWNYYWNHNLYFSGAHTGQNYIAGTGLSAYNIDMNRYYNVIMTHDNSGGAHKVYIDGSLQQSSTQSNPTLSSGNIRRFFVGNWDTSWSCVGCIPLIRVYNRALTAAEVNKNFKGTKVRFNL